ncbi:glycoside hydrolase family protein [Poseidonocella sp. HB161398]|uniref:glycoside hydrolase family protein n=1 Tax=Poseidonocella sp. HB161398 TaxID=2320855 RepID=UPI001109A8BD|nr:glycoside hydrolase family protein [Poseidonocella sp. HB161398]
MASTPMTPMEQRLLDAIAGSESPGYDAMYGGARFTDFSDHPRQFFDIANGPNTGQRTSAAGRYQFLSSTWDAIAPRAGVTDFSPRSQDAAAITLARDDYRRRTGRDLTADLEDPSPSNLLRVANSLSGTWTSLPGGIEPNDATAGFLARMGTDAAPGTATAQADDAYNQIASSMLRELAAASSPAGNQENPAADQDEAANQEPTLTFAPTVISALTGSSGGGWL